MASQRIASLLIRMLYQVSSNVPRVALGRLTLVVGCNMFAAGSITTSSTRAQIMNRMISRASEKVKAGAFPLVYNGDSGDFASGTAR